MLSNSAELVQSVGETGEGECFCCQCDKPGHLLTAFPSLIRAQDDAQLFSCPFLRPVHSPAPHFQFKSGHDSPRDMQIFRNSPAEILTNYERIALSEVGFYL